MAAIRFQFMPRADFMVVHLSEAFVFTAVHVDGRV